MPFGKKNQHVKPVILDVAKDDLSTTAENILWATKLNMMVTLDVLEQPLQFSSPSLSLLI